MYNRKQRRLIEKELGLFKKMKTATPEQKKEIQKRKREMGRQIHIRNTQEAQHALETARAENSAKLIQSLIEKGKTPEEAEKIAQAHQLKHEEREARIAKKKND